MPTLRQLPNICNVFSEISYNLTDRLNQIKNFKYKVLDRNILTIWKNENQSILEQNSRGTYDPRIAADIVYFQHYEIS